MGYFNDEDFVVQNDKLWDLGKKITSKTDELDAYKPKPTWDVNGDTNSSSTASDYTGVDSAGISKEDMSGEHGEPLTDYPTNKVKYVAVAAHENAANDKTTQTLMNLRPGEKITADMFADTNSLVTENFDTFKGTLSHINDKYVKATDMYKDYMANDEEKLNESRNLAKTINEAYGREVINSDTLLANNSALDNARRLSENIQKHQELIGSNSPADVQDWLMVRYPELANLSAVDGAIALANLKSIQQTAGIIDSGLIGAESASIQAERSNILLQHFLGKEFTYQDKKRLVALTDRYARLKEQMPSYGASPLANMVGQTVEQFGGMGQDVLAGQAVAGGAGLVTGAYTLAHTGQIQAAKLAFKTAYRAAQPIAKGVSELSMFKRQVGEKFYEYENMSRDSAGNEALLSTDDARTYAILETAVETGIEFYNYNDVMNLLGGGAKAKVAAIVSENAGNKEAIMAGIKQIVANKAGSFAKVMAGETSEEAEQNLTDNLFHNFIVSKYGSDKEKLYSKQEMANSSVDAAIDAVPSVFGMTVAGEAASSLSFVRKVARANVIKENYSQEQINNAFMSKTLTDLADDAKTNELAKKQPEIYAQVVKEEMKKNGIETVSVDTELLAKEDGGLELLKSIGEKMGMSDEKLASTISSGASLDVPMEVYCQTVLSGDMANTVIDMSSNSPDIACPKRTKEEAERIKKIYADIVKQDAEDKNSLINAVVNSTFATDSEKELATEILTAYSDDPEAGRQKYLKQLEAEYAKYLQPYINILNEGWGKGVGVMQDDITNPNAREEGRGVKVSNNAPWYGEWYKEHKRQPTKADLQSLAYDLLTGTNDYGVQGFGYELMTSPETQEGISQGFQEQKVKLDRMLSDIQALKDMQGKMESLNLNAEAVATGLSPEAFGAYKAIEAELNTSANDAIRKVAKMNAVLLARHAQRMVEAGLFKSVGEYFGGVTINPNGVYQNGQETTAQKLNQSAWHGSPHVFEKFDLGAIGTGEGAQVHGWGLYFAQDRSISEKRYKDRLGVRSNQVITEDGVYNYADDGTLFYTENGNDNAIEIEYDSAEKYAIDFIIENGSAEESAKSLKAKIEEAKKNNYESVSSGANNDIYIEQAEEILNLLQNDYNDFRVSTGSLFEVDIPETDTMLDEQKKFKEQPKKVQDGLIQAIVEVEAMTNESFLDTIEESALISYSYLEETPPLEELNGWDIYSALEVMLRQKGKGAREVSLTLNKYGIKGITYDGQTDGRCFVVFDDKAVNIINRYNQQMNEGKSPLGTISIMENGKRIVDLFSNANESTLLHESGHLFLDDLRRASQQPNADKQIISDWNTVRDWLGMAEGQEKPTTAQHEKFADGFVAYLKTGEAPARGLKGAFQSFKSWLIGWYKDFTQAGGAKPTKEVAEVMGRMIASQDEVDIENKRRQVESFTKSKGYDILDEETAKKLVRWQDKAKKEAEEKVLAQALEDIEKGEKEFNAQVLDNIRRGVEEDLAGENIFKAEAALEAMNGDTSVLQNFGYTEEQYRAELKARGGSFEKAVELEMKNARQEVNSKNKTQDEIQALAQKAVLTSRYREMAAALELQALTKLQEKLAKEAPNKKDNELKGIKKAIRVVRDEALGTVKTYREAARQALAGMTIGQATDSKMWERKEAEKTQESLKAMAKGDWQAALEAKRQQLLYASMARQSFNLKDKAEKMAKTVLKRNEVLDKGKEKMPASERYYYQHLSYVMGLRKTDAIAPMTLIPFRELMKANNTIDGESDVNGYGDKIDVPDFILQAVFADKPINNNAGYQGLNFEQLKALSDFLKTLYHTGINKDNLVAVKGENGESLKVSDVVSNLIVEIERNIGTKGNGTTDLEKKSNIEHAETFMGSFFLGELLHPETVLQRIDGYIAKTGKSINGIANRLIFEPMNKARSKEILMTSDTTAKLKAIFGVYSNSELDDIRNKKTILLGENLLTKEQVISMALNCGTEKNLQRLVDGLVLSGYEQTLSPEEAHKFRYRLIMDALSSLDGRDWQVVQDIWALFDGFYEENSRQEEITRGIPLGKEVASPFSVVAKDGTKYDLKGGYFPIVYDSELSSKAADQKQDITAKSQMSGNARFGIGRGSTKARSTKVTGRPLLFSLDVISRKLDESIHNICFRATVRDINRIISNEQFKQALTNATSKAQYKVVADWVRDCWATEIVQKGAVGKIAQALRHNTTQAVLGFRLSTAIMNVCNFPLMVEQVGIGNFFGAYKDFMSNLKGNYNFINQLSPFMANRAETMDINMRESYAAQQKKLSKGGISDFIKNQSFKVIGFTDNIFAYPLWLSEYKRVFNEDMQAGKENIVAQQNAIQAGDRAVRRIIGSGEIKDLAPMQKNKDEFYKSVTMFYTFYSAVYNQMANKYFAKEQNKRTKYMTGYKAFAPIVRGAFYYWIMQSALEGAIRGLLSKDDNKDAKWWAKHFGRTFIENGLGTIPIVRDIGRAGLDVAMGGYGSDGFKMTSAYDGFKRATQIIGTTRKAIKPDKEKKGAKYSDWVDVARDVGKTFNSFTGTPDMITDSITTFARYAKNDFDNSFWEYVGNTAMDRKLQKTRDVRGRKVPKAKPKKKK